MYTTRLYRCLYAPTLEQEQYCKDTVCHRVNISSLKALRTVRTDYKVCDIEVHEQPALCTSSEL